MIQAVNTRAVIEAAAESREEEDVGHTVDVNHKVCTLWHPGSCTTPLEAQGAGDRGGLPPISPRWR